ncbi:MAG TPA: [FeFe] hydrogenase H-cluster radical SAM maturase HydG [Verrucomicrobia bacterium]|nr:MAG: [FeFe] hydrogenase H-cluster radical SAM maturase HydG [Lentisphaerae bacterium GWF2_57_35]HBA85961.1 [FeFe] hydrogenase H-cluster radical SAM maturase HydG [Verrucomicrobiota bacterium]
MTTIIESKKDWVKNRIVREEIDKYMPGGRDFIDDDRIESLLLNRPAPDAGRVREILAKSMAVQALALDELADLIQVTDAELWQEMRQTAALIKQKVYDNRIVTFAPLYLSTKCVNNCAYCGLRCENQNVERSVLSQDEIRAETEILAGKIGHKRLIVVYGEHPDCGIDYMTESMRTIYRVKTKARKGTGQIRRININAAPMSVRELEILKECGLGTFQVFQETYHHKTYAALHPAGTIKGDYPWRLYCMHRAQEAGIDDNGIGVLFGLYDWRFELLGLLSHAHELEKAFGIGPHTISFPRLEPADNTPFTNESKYRMSDADMEKLVVLIRLAVPYTGMILTARENPDMRRRLIPLGCTQTDASSRIGIGAYSETYNEQVGTRQQFLLGDTRSLDEMVRELAEMGCITSFCTAGYRCGRTGKCIMDLLRSGQEGKFCKLNAVLTFREWLDDFASPETQAVGETILQKELEEVRVKMPKTYPQFIQHYERTAAGERDLYF